MKNLVLATLVVLGSVAASAKALSLKDMQQIVPNMERAGTQGADYKCSVKTEWLENGDLKVVATQQYKDWAPSTTEVVFTQAKDLEVYKEKYDEDIFQYAISQSTLLSEEDEYRVDLYESFYIDVEKSEITGLTLQIAEVDHENDPHEDMISCEFAK